MMPEVSIYHFMAIFRAFLLIIGHKMNVCTIALNTFGMNMKCFDGLKYDIPEMNKSRARHSPLVAVFRADFKSDLHIVKYFLVAEWHACKVFCQNLFFNQK